MKRLRHIIFLFFLVCISLNGQDYFKLDSTQYKLGINTRYLNSVSTFRYGEKKYSYNIDQQSIGLRVRYKKAAVLLNLVGFPLMERQNRPSSLLVCVVRLYPKNMYFRFDGSYMSHNYSLIDYIRNINNSYTTDLLILNLDIYGLYMLNKDKINVQSFLAFKHQQLRSAGSWTINTYVKSSFIQNDHETLVGLGFDQNVIPDNMFYTRLGLGFGYIYSLKIMDNLHWANMLSIANELHYVNTYGENSSDTQTDFLTLLRPHAFSCMTYSHSKIYIGLQFEYFPSQRSSLTENSYTLDFYCIKLSGGYRW